MASLKDQTIHFRAAYGRLFGQACKRPSLEKGDVVPVNMGTTSPDKAKVTCKLCLAILGAT